MKAWDAVSDERYHAIWNQIRASLHPGRNNTPEHILDGLSRDETWAFFHHLCHDYGYSMMFGGDSKRKEKHLVEFEITLDLMHRRQSIEPSR